MLDLWHLALSAWPGALPQQQPAGVIVDKVRLTRGALVRVQPGALILVLCGGLSEWMSPDLDRTCIVREYGPREPIPMPVGQLRADIKTELLVFAPGWEAALPEAHALVRMLRDAEAVDLKHRLSVVMCLSLTERVRRYVDDHAIDVNSAQRQRLANVLGGSREMVSRVLKEMATEQGA